MTSNSYPTTSRAARLMMIAALTAATFFALPTDRSRAEGLAGSRPNIVLVMTDDQGYGSLACHGSPILSTPHLDAMHKRSTRLVNFHVSPTCAPTRAAMLSGRHEFYAGVTHTILERERMALSITTFPQVLRKAGYTTGIFGKWHLGDEDEYQPDRRGFDEVFIHGAGGIGQSYKCSCGDAPGNKYFNPAIRHNGRFVKTEGFCTDVFFDQAMSWIESCAEGDRPFFAYISTNAAHGPFICPESYAKPYRDAGLDARTVGHFGMITNIDDNMGKLFARLEALKMLENTLVIFMTDNGSALGNVFNAGMRSQKGSVYEGGVRVPCFFCWKGKIREGIDLTQLTSNIDFYTTFLELAGTEVPENVTTDGRSLLPILEDAQADWPNRYLIHQKGRWGRGQAAGAKFKSAAVRDERFKLVDGNALYDLIADPGEATNIIEQHPEVVARLRAEYDRWWNDIQPFMVNEDVEMLPYNPFRRAYIEQFRE